MGLLIIGGTQGRVNGLIVIKRTETISALGQEAGVLLSFSLVDRVRASSFLVPFTLTVGKVFSGFMPSRLPSSRGVRVGKNRRLFSWRVTGWKDPFLSAREGEAFLTGSCPSAPRARIASGATVSPLWPVGDPRWKPAQACPSHCSSAVEPVLGALIDWCCFHLAQAERVT